MAQDVKFVNIEDSYIPVDPNAYPLNLFDPSYGDKTSRPASIVAYDGYNFLPTSYGYKSYFGTDYQLDVAQLSSKADYVLVFQNAYYENMLIALCEDGIWTKRAATSGAWVHAVEHTIDEEHYYPWHWAMLNNDLYMYRQGREEVYKMTYSLTTFLNERPVIDPDISITVGAGGNPSDVGASYAIAYKLENGYTNPSPWVTNDTSDIIQSLTFPFYDGEDGAVAPEVRLYRLKADGTYWYADYPLYATDATQWVIPNIWQIFWAALPEWPDTSWYPQLYGAFYAPQAIYPSFLNMKAQLGMFVAGIRLGFWDAENSISWSSIDDYTDFTPSLETLAGSSIYPAVEGKIVAIRTMGTGFVVYSTMAIVHIEKALDSAFLWTPTKLLSSGITYPRQVVSSREMDTHYVYGTSGIWRIKKGVIEPLLPDFYDLTKNSIAPIYLSLLADRYLMFQIMDQNYDLRTVQIREATVPGDKWIISDEILSGTELTDLGDLTNYPTYKFCTATATVKNSHSAAGHGSGDSDPEGTWTPLYITSYSMGNVPAFIDWRTDGTCMPVRDKDEVPLAFYPYGVFEGANNHRWVVEDDVAEPLFWNNVDKFVATQYAIWEKMDKAREGLIAQIQTKTYEGFKVTNTVIHPDTGFAENVVGTYGLSKGDLQNIPVPADPPNEGTCTLGYIPLAFSAPKVKVNDCGVFITRQCIARAKVVVHTFKSAYTKKITKQGAKGWHGSLAWPPCGAPSANELFQTLMPSPANVMARYEELAVACPGGGFSAGQAKRLIAGGDQFTVVLQRYYQPAIGPWEWHNLGSIAYYEAGKIEVGYTKRAYLLVTEVEEGIFATDTAAMIVKGWHQYSTSTYKERSTMECDAPAEDDEPYKSPDAKNDIPIDKNTGYLCGAPYVPANLPAEYGGPLVWPAQSIVLPELSFLLQDGATAPAYPTFYGSYVYDLYLKKWGRHKDTFQLYVDYTPINNSQDNGIPYDTFIIKGGILTTTGYLAVFNDNPLRSEICYGKIGYYRKGYTDAEEVTVQFRTHSTGYVRLEPSLTGRYAEVAYGAVAEFTDSLQTTLFANISARWYNIVISGKYDISYLEFRGVKAARR